MPHRKERAARALSIIALATSLAAAPAVHAQSPAPVQAPTDLPARVEVHALPSKTFDARGFLVGGAPGKDVLLGGVLRLPRGTAAKWPAVILVHGSGGFHGGNEAWARALNEAGIASFVLDSFSGRGIVSTAEDQDQLHSLAMQPAPTSRSPSTRIRRTATTT